MMNEHGKSDRPMLPGKSPNKAGIPEAEEMQGRGLAKGNPSQQDAIRTQSWAKPVRRVYIPKADGRQRPLGVTALEDKLVQRATVELLNAIYETDFLGFSYGFRPGRSQHKALDALGCGLQEKRVD